MAKKEKKNVNNIATLAVEPEVGERIITFATANTYVPHNIEVTIPSGGSSGTVLLQQKTVTPSTTTQIVTADAVYDGLSEVIVNPIPVGTAGTPVATKSTVSNHSIDIIPSVENSTGYIIGGTKNGSAATVTAADLVSGSQTINTNTTTDVTNLKEVVTTVPLLLLH